MNISVLTSLWIKFWNSQEIWNWKRRTWVSRGNKTFTNKFKDKTIHILTKPLPNKWKFFIWTKNAFTAVKHQYLGHCYDDPVVIKDANSPASEELLVFCREKVNFHPVLNNPFYIHLVSRNWRPPWKKTSCICCIRRSCELQCLVCLRCRKIQRMGDCPNVSSRIIQWSSKTIKSPFRDRL